MNAHTPGPWTVGNWGDVEAGAGFIVASPNGTPDGDYDANARLIAAAPDLLAALEQTQRILDRLYSRFSEDDEIGERFHLNAALIHRVRASGGRA